MRAAGLFPKFLETSSLGAFRVVNAYDDHRSATVMHPSACTGLSTCEYTAALKALTEWLERQVVRSSPEAFPNGTEGVAGWDVPSLLHKRGSQISAEGHALREACERNIWSRWCDDASIGHTVLEGNNLARLLTPAGKAARQFLYEILPKGELIAVVPNASDVFPSKLIFAAYLLAGDQGVITGGAAAPVGKETGALEHGLTELVRHALAFNRAIGDGVRAKSVYDQRLIWMASPAGFASLKNRLSCGSSDAEVSMPSFEYNETIQNPGFSFATFHRVGFVDHPAFIGTHVERLCL